MTYSTIKRKKCKCGECDKMPTLGFEGFYYLHAGEEIKERNGEKSKKAYQVNRERQNLANLSRKVSTYANENNALKSPKISLKLLLIEADALFSHYLRDMWADNSGILSCYCCDRKGLKIDRVDNEDSSSDILFNNGHFVARSIYSLRYSIENCKVLCCFCNAKMSHEPRGEVYQTYRTKLIKVLGETKVQWMEAQKYVVNKLTHSDLDNIIKKYKK